MAPNKFEKHIKKQLEEREMQPSSTAWEKLSEKLDAATPQSSKRRYLWYGIAASFIGLLILSVVFFNANTPISETNTIVIEDKKEAIEEMNDFQNIEIEKTKAEVVSMEKTTEEKVKENTDKANIQIVEKEVFVEQLEEVADYVQVPLNDDSEEIINTKLLQVLAQIDFLEKDKLSLTDSEVDSLLRKAQEEILQDQIFNENGSVDAMALLTEVEGELDQTFRDQIFESLKSGFLKVRTAVADRNN